MLIDPPMGWRYGFPKKLPTPEPADIVEWLISEGYPRALYEELKTCFHYRCIYEEGETL
jgi:hypothetical protein